jgi:hypothetical protein
MYGIVTNIYPKNHPNPHVGNYTIHGAYGIGTLAGAKKNPSWMKLGVSVTSFGSWMME